MRSLLLLLLLSFQSALATAPESVYQTKNFSEFFKAAAPYLSARDQAYLKSRLDAEPTAEFPKILRSQTETQIRVKSDMLTIKINRKTKIVSIDNRDHDFREASSLQEVMERLDGILLKRKRGTSWQKFFFSPTEAQAAIPAVVALGLSALGSFVIYNETSTVNEACQELQSIESECEGPVKDMEEALSQFREQQRLLESLEDARLANESTVRSYYPLRCPGDLIRLHAFYVRQGVKSGNDNSDNDKAVAESLKAAYDNFIESRGKVLTIIERVRKARKKVPLNVIRPSWFCYDSSQNIEKKCLQDIRRIATEACFIDRLGVLGTPATPQAPNMKPVPASSGATAR